MKYIKRISESGEPQSIVEYLQGGILIRFNEIEVKKEEEGDKNRMFRCTEFWFDLMQTIPEIEAIVTENGFELTENYKTLLK